MRENNSTAWPEYESGNDAACASVSVVKGKFEMLNKIKIVRSSSDRGPHVEKNDIKLHASENDPN